MENIRREWKWRKIMTGNTGNTFIIRANSKTLLNSVEPISRLNVPRFAVYQEAY